MTVFADSFADDLARRVASIVLESLPASDPSPWLIVDRAADYLDTGNPGARRVAAPPRARSSPESRPGLRAIAPSRLESPNARLV